eukprot:scaffold18759_cov107-Isochrysis_galbana.AAC.1
MPIPSASLTIAWPVRGAPPFSHASASASQASRSSVVVGLLQPRGCDPDLRLGRDGLARLVQHLPGVAVRLEAGERQPHVDRVRHALHRPAQHKPRVLGRLQVDGRLPELDAIGHNLERLAQHPPPHRQVGLERGSLQPDFDRGGDLLDGLGQHRLGVLRRLQPRCLQPHILIPGTRAAAVAHHAPRGHQLAGNLLEPRGGDPAGAVAGVGLCDRLEQQPCLLDVADLGLDRVGHLIQLDRQHRVARLADGLEVGERDDRRSAAAPGQHRLHPTVHHLLIVQSRVNLGLHPGLLEQRVGRGSEALLGPPLHGARLAVLARLGQILPLVPRHQRQLPLQVAKLVLQLGTDRAELVERLLQLLLAPRAAALVHLGVHLGPDRVSRLVVLVVRQILRQRLRVAREFVKVGLGQVGLRVCRARRTNVGPGGEAGGASAEAGHVVDRRSRVVRLAAARPHGHRPRLVRRRGAASGARARGRGARPRRAAGIRTTTKPAL